MLPPRQADKLLFGEDCCKCDLEWHCVPHNACFIHDSCFCEGSGSFPPVKPPHPSWSQFSHEWLVELASRLSCRPVVLPPPPASEVPLPFVMPYYHSWLARYCLYLPSLLLGNSYCLEVPIVSLVSIVLCPLRPDYCLYCLATLLPSTYSSISSLCTFMRLSK